MKEWYESFTDGENKMYPKGIAKFIQGVSSSNEEIFEDEEKVTSFLKENDKDQKGYVSEEEFIAFYKKAASTKKSTITVWKNLKNMNIREDLKKEGEPYDIEFCVNLMISNFALMTNYQGIN